MPVDYSKWDHIEISDDEDDTHPNVDTPSLFKWRHEARIQKEDEKKSEQVKKGAQEKLRLQELEKITTEIAKLELITDRDEPTESKLTGLKSKQAEIETQQADFTSKEKELAEYEKAHPSWNVDNMSTDKHNRTLINKSVPKAEGTSMDLSAYFKEHGDEVKAWGMLSKYEESHKYLKDRMYLVCDHLASFLVVWAVDLEVEEKKELMKRVAHQAIVAQYILELAKTLKRDPRSTVDAFFTRIGSAEQQYLDAFQDEYKSLIARVQARAIARLEEAQAEAAAEEAADREKRLGPGGLDPLEILEEIPAKMKEAFQTQNTPMLKESFAELSEEEAGVVYRKVVDSGLWVPQEGDGMAAGAADDAAEAGAAEADAAEADAAD